jgi:hypothetical protein
MVQPDIRRHIAKAGQMLAYSSCVRAVRDVAGFISSLEKRSYLRQIVDKGLDMLKEILARSQLEVDVQRVGSLRQLLLSFNSLYLGFLHESRNIKYPYVMFELGLQ